MAEDVSKLMRFMSNVTGREISEKAKAIYGRFTALAHSIAHTVITIERAIKYAMKNAHRSKKKNSKLTLFPHTHNK